MPVDIGLPFNFSLAQLSLFFIETLRFCFCPCLQNAGSSPRGPTVSEADVQMQRELVRQQQEFLQQQQEQLAKSCLLYTSPSPRDLSTSRMPSSA